MAAHGIMANRSLAIPYIQHILDRILPPPARKQAYEATSQFATSRPILFSLIITHIFFSAIPLLAFAIFVLSVVFISLVGLLLFVLSAIALALLILVPSLCLTSAVAVVAWTWLVGSFLVARWLYDCFSVPIVAWKNDDGKTAQEKPMNKKPMNEKPIKQEEGKPSNEGIF